jgi:hypothetical protein
MILKTAKGSRFDTSKPAKSNVIMVLNEDGNSIMDSLRITGRYTVVTEFMESVTMIEVEHSFGIDEVNEDFIWQ